MNIYPISTKQVLLLAFLLTLFPIFTFAQSALFNPISLEEANLNEEQLAKFENFISNPIHKRVDLIRLGDIEEIQQRDGLLPISIPSNPRKEYHVYATSVEASSEREYVWQGQTREGDHATVTIIAENGATFGQINIADDMYKLMDLGNEINVLVELDKSKFGPSECATLHGEPRRRSAQSHGRTNNNVVRVLVLFTAASNQAGNPQNDATLFINQTNTACANSNITSQELTFQLAGVQQLPGFVEDPLDIFGDHDQLRLNGNAQNMRNQAQADIVVLLTDGNYVGQNGNIFGVAYLDQSGDDNFGYAISEIDAAGGRFTFTHEVAHLFGARHETDTRVEPFLSPFAHGHNFQTGWWIFSRTRRTILNSLPANRSRIQHFSNPNVNFKNVATGIANDRDNARQLRDMACTVADYRPFNVPFNVQINGTTVFQQNGFNNWFASTQGCNNITNYQWAWSTNGFSYTNFGGNSSSAFLSSVPPGSQIVFIRLTATCSTGQVDQAFLFLMVGNGNPFREGSEETGNQVDEAKDKGRLKDLISSQALKITSFPNPASDVFTIQTDLVKAMKAKISIMDLMGRELKVLHDGKLEAGVHLFEENAQNYQSGYYHVIVLTQEGLVSSPIVFNP